jgi:hypothetical protein
VLRKILRPVSREVTKDGRKLHKAGVKYIKKNVMIYTHYQKYLMASSVLSAIS